MNFGRYNEKQITVFLLILFTEFCVFVSREFNGRRFVLFLCTTAVWQFAINEYVMLC